MLHIAICDDQPKELETVVAYTKEYIKANQMDVELQQFVRPDTLLTTCETERFHLYVLDIVMPIANGIEVGREIRRLDHEAQIIYATSEPSFALEAYSVNPVNYLLKPIDKSKLFNTLDLAISKLHLADEAIIMVNTKEGLRVVPLFTIVYCEYTDHIVRYTLASGETIISKTLRESFPKHIAPLLRDKRFLQPHNAFVLNMSSVEGFSKEGFALRGGMTVPVSSKQYGIARDSYMDFLLTNEVRK